MAQDTLESALPNHVGFILDGNRRWAKEKGLPTLKGHAQGAEVLRTIALATFDSGIRCMSAYLFSTENWSRSKPEVTYLMRLIIRFIDKYLEEFVKKEVKMVHVGSRDGLPKAVLQAIDHAVETTKEYKQGIFGLCINYGGQQEVIDATRKLLRQGIDPNRLTPKDFERALYAPELPPVDLIIRTSGEARTSGFMLYRAAYAEFVFIDKYWPDFTRYDLHEALKSYVKRHRRFGR